MQAKPPPPVAENADWTTIQDHWGCLGAPRNSVGVDEAGSTPPLPLPTTSLRPRSSSTKVQKRAALVVVVIDVRMRGEKLRGSLNRRGVRDEDTVWYIIH